MSGATLCFVIYENKILLINRNKPPFMGLWNAVGGHIEQGETPEQCAVREIKEESGITVKSVELQSVFTWNYDDETGYVFVAKIDKDIDVSHIPFFNAEGIIEFKDIDWVLNEKNYGVIEDQRVFINDIQNNRKNNYHMVYENSKLIEAIIKT